MFITTLLWLSIAFKRKTALSILLLFAGITSNSAQITDVFEVPFPRQYQVLDSIFDNLALQDTLMASSVLEHLRAAAMKSGDALTLLNFKQSVIRYRYIRIFHAQNTPAIKALINDAEKLLETVEVKKYPVIAALIHKTLGNTIEFKVYKYPYSFEHYLKAYELFKDIPVKEFPDRQYAQYSIALAYYQYKDYKNALKLGEEIETIYPQKNPISVFTVNLIGMSHLKLAQYTEAIPHFQWILENYPKCAVSPAWEGIAWGNIGQAYYLMGDYNAALPCLEKGVDITVREHVSDNAAGFAALLSSLYLRQENMPMAKKYVDIAQQEANKSRDISNFHDAYAAQSDYYRQTGNTALALQYQDSIFIYRDSLEKINDVRLKFSAEMAIEKERWIYQEKINEAERSRNRIILIGSLLFAFLVLLVILLLFNRRQLKHLNEKQQFLSRQKLAQNELNNAKKQLLDFTKSIVQKNELIEQASSEIERITAAFHQLQSQQQETKSFDTADDQAFSSMHETVLVTKTGWDDFAEMFDKVYPGFFLRLKQKMPDLSPAEKRFIALSKLNLDNREMAAMLAVSTDAVRQSRSRLKKKLDLGDDASLKEIIDSV